jgi:hypothetical protein
MHNKFAQTNTRRDVCKVIVKAAFVLDPYSPIKCNSGGVTERLPKLTVFLSLRHGGALLLP